jgi:hypothetical protein
MWGTHIHLRRRFAQDDFCFFYADCPKGEVRGVIRVAGDFAAYFRMRMEECDAIFADDLW